MFNALLSDTDVATIERFRDVEHLRLLRIAYLISGGVNAVFAFFPLIHVTFGVLMLAGMFPAGGADRLAGLMFLLLGLTLSGIFATAATVKLVAARRLRERRSLTFCRVVGGLTSLGIPYGTAIGAFTLIVLRRPSVIALFERQA